MGKHRVQRFTVSSDRVFAESGQESAARHHLRQGWSAGYIGRVGTLAVALGIGAAVATPAGVAYADDTTGDDNSVSAPDPDRTPTTPRISAPSVPDLVQAVTTIVRRHLPRTTLDEPDAGPEPDFEDPTIDEDFEPPSAPDSDIDDDLDLDLESETEVQSPAGRSTRAVQQPAPVVLHRSPHPAPDPVPLDIPRAAGTALPSATFGGIPVSAPPAPRRAAVAATAAAAPALNPAQSLLAIPGTLITVVTNALAPWLAPRPGTPSPNPVLWAVLAWTRRQFINGAPAFTDVDHDPQPDRTTLVDLDATDPDDDRLTYAATNGSHGTVTVDPHGDRDGSSFVYTPNPGYTGTDTFTVTASDTGNGFHLIDLFTPRGGNTTATTITVTVPPAGPPPQPDPTQPVTLDPALPADPPGTVRGRVNIVAAEDDPVSFSGPVPSPAGVVTVDPDGSFAYTPSPQAQHAAAADDAATTGADTHTFTVTATNSGGSVDIPVTVPVGPPVNAAPNPAPDPADPEVDHGDGTVTGAAGYTDPDGDELTYTGPASGTSAGGGTVSVQPDGTYTYTPTLQDRLDAFNTPGDDTDTFTVGVSDGHGSTSAVTVTVPVDPVGAAVTDTSTVTLPPGELRYLSEGPDGTIAAVTDDGERSVLTVIHPDGSTTSDTGARAGEGVHVGADGTVARAAYTGVGTAADPYITTLTVVHPGGDITSHTTPGKSNGLTVGADGTVAMTTITDNFLGPVQSTVTVVRPDGSSVEQTTPGLAQAPMIGTDGTVYFSAYTGTGNAGDPLANTLTVINPDGTATVTTAPGRWYEDVTGADGTIALTSYAYDDATDTYSTTYLVVHPDGSSTTATTPGFPTGLVRIGADGTTAHATTTDSGQTNLTVIRPDGSVGVHTADGYPDVQLSVGPDGTVGLATTTGDGSPEDPYQSTLTVIDAAGTVSSHTVTGYPDIVTAGADGTVTMTSSTGDGSAADPYRTTTTVIDPDGNATDHIAQGSPLGQSVGADGTVATGSFTGDGSPEDPFQTTVTVIDPDGTTTTHMAAGSLVGLEVGPDGTTAFITESGDGSVEEPFRYSLVVVHPDGSTTTADGVGRPDGRIVIGTDGTTAHNPYTGDGSPADPFQTYTEVVHPSGAVSRIDMDGGPATSLHLDAKTITVGTFSGTGAVEDPVTYHGYTVRVA